MRFFTDTESYVPLFNGELEYCRAIDDHFIIFERSGRIIHARTSDPLLRDAESFFDFMSSEDAESVKSLCTSFDLHLMVADTKFGGAIIFNELLGISGLLLAVIPFCDAGLVFEHFNKENRRHVWLSGNGISGAVSGDTERVKSVMNLAEGAISCAETRAAIYSFGASIGKYLAEKILIISDFIGCVGSSRTELEALPNLTNFSAEIFNLFTLLTVAFARDFGARRNFNATIGEAEGHVVVSFCIDVDEGFTLYRNGRLQHKILDFCYDVAASRDIIFDVSLHREQNRLTISFTPESDPFINRVIKQTLRELIKSFWDNAL